MSHHHHQDHISTVKPLWRSDWGVVIRSPGLLKERKRLMRQHHVGPTRPSIPHQPHVGPGQEGLSCHVSAGSGYGGVPVMSHIPAAGGRRSPSRREEVPLAGGARRLWERHVAGRCSGGAIPGDAAPGGDAAAAAPEGDAVGAQLRRWAPHIQRPRTFLDTGLYQ